MKISAAFLFASLLASAPALFAQTSGSGGEGVAVGTSDLIGTVQYSDTFTIGSGASSGTRNGQTYSVGGYPLTTEEAVLEARTLRITAQLRRRGRRPPSA
jgi:hypothetical protein